MILVNKNDIKRRLFLDYQFDDKNNYLLCVGSRYCLVLYILIINIFITILCIVAVNII